jgi:small subunit ribosomal protein S16
MSVAIRFSRQGKKKSPFYRIVAADKRCARDGRFIELLGTYHPITKVLKLDRERFEKWRKVGAKPSGTLAAVIRRTERAAAAPGSSSASSSASSGPKKTA